MTQMGLDYQKHMETKRHNLATEGLQSGQLELDTRKHVDTLPIEQQKADASTRQSFAAMSTAQTKAAEHQHMVDNYERELALKTQQAEGTYLRGSAAMNQAQAALSQADTASDRLSLDTILGYRAADAKDKELYIKEFDATTQRIMADLQRSKNEDERVAKLAEYLPEIARQWYITQYLDIDERAMGSDWYFLINSYIPSKIGSSLIMEAIPRVDVPITSKK